MISVRYLQHSKFGNGELWVIPTVHHIDSFLDALRNGEACSENDIIIWKDFVNRLAKIPSVNAIPAKPADLYPVVHSAFISLKKLPPELEELEKYKFSKGVVEALVNLFFMFDEAGLTEAEQLRKSFESGDNKYSTFVIEVYGRYRKFLHERNILTSADICRLAIDAITENGVLPFNGVKKVVFHNFVEFTVPQENLIKELSKIIDIDFSFPIPEQYCNCRWGKSIGKMLANFGISSESDHAERNFENLINEKKIDFFAFSSATNECRFLARNIAKRITESGGQLKFDDVVVVCPSAEQYKKLLASEFSSFGWCKEPDRVEDYLTPIIEGIVLLFKSNMRREEVVNFCSLPVIASSFNIDVSEFKTQLLEAKIVRFDVLNDKNMSYKSYKQIDSVYKILADLKFLEDEYALKQLPDLIEKIGIVLKPLGEKVADFRDQYAIFLDSARRFVSFYSADISGKGYEILQFFSQFISLEDEEVFCPIKVLPPEEARGITDKQWIIWAGFTRENFPRKHMINPFLPALNDVKFFVSDRAGIDRASVLTILNCLPRTGELYVSFPLTELDGRDTGPPAEIIELIFRKDLSIEKIEVNTEEKMQKILLEIPSKWELTLTESEKPLETEKKLPDISIKQIIFHECEIRATQIVEFASCPYRFFLKSILGEFEPPELEKDIPKYVIGKAVHSALAKFYGDRIRSQFGLVPNTIGKILQVIDELSVKARDEIDMCRRRVAITEENKEECALLLSSIMKEELNNAYEQFGDIPPEHQKEKYLMMLVKDLQNKSGPIWDFLIEEEVKIEPQGLPVGVEVEIETIDCEPKIKGRIDRIDWIGDKKVRIIDYKTGKLPDTDLQLSVYKYIINNIAVADIKFIWSLASYLRKEKKKESKQEEIGVDKISEYIRNMWGEDEAFFIRAKNKNCYYCDFAELCQSKDNYDYSSC